ncbi:nucleoporin 62 like [Syngnathoides biaculeatus]|uniref:nucleoporin 62 like n=1 Tax=Syngnathoides biaculeatus TaxID=300417 RepID=UPI002ADD7838|nr:nucleoporin 62 like [Syngnathoides biaculeatus]
MSGGFNFGQPSTGFSFGVAKTTAPVASTVGFGLTTSTPAGSGGGFSFGSSTQTVVSSNPSGGFSFGTPAKSTAAGGSLSFGTPTATTFTLNSAPQPASTAGLTLGSTAAPAASSGFSLGSGLTAPAGGGFSFGTSAQAPAQAQPVAPAPTTTTSASGGLSFGGFSFGGNKVQVTTAAQTTSAPGAGFSFGSSAAPNLTLGAQPTTTTVAPAPQGGGFSLGIKPSSTPAPPAVTQVAPSLFSAPTTTTTATTSTAAGSGFTFGATPAATTTAASGGLSFSLKPLGAATSSATTASAAPAPSTASGFSLGLKPASVTSAVTIAAAPAAAALSIATAPAVMTYTQLEGLINKWSLELEDQERHFLQQATQVNAWDRMLVENGERITSLHKEMEKVKLDQKRLNQELDFILSQQKELEDLLCPLEESVKEQSGTIYMQNADEERERTYKLAENVDAQLKRMSQDLKEIIEHLNTSSGPADTSDPLQQICKILNAHMDSLQWIDQNSVLLQRRVEEVSKLCDNQHKEQEKTFRLTFD